MLSNKHMDAYTQTLTSLSLPELDSVSLVPATALWSEWAVCEGSVFGTDTMVPSSDTWDFSVSLSMPAGMHESQETNNYLEDKSANLMKRPKPGMKNL